MAARKARSKRQPDGELVSGMWEGFKSQQEAMEAHLGTDGVAAARDRADRGRCLPYH